MLGVFGREMAAAVDCHLRAVQVLEGLCEAEEGLLEGDFHQVDQVAALSRPLFCWHLHHSYLEIGRSAEVGLFSHVSKREGVAVGQSFFDRDFDDFHLGH